MPGCHTRGGRVWAAWGVAALLLLVSLGAPSTPIPNRESAVGQRRLLQIGEGEGQGGDRHGLNMRLEEEVREGQVSLNALRCSHPRCWPPAPQKTQPVGGTVWRPRSIWSARAGNAPNQAANHGPTLIDILWRLRHSGWAFGLYPLGASHLGTPPCEYHPSLMRYCRRSKAAHVVALRRMAERQAAASR